MNLHEYILCVSKTHCNKLLYVIEACMDACYVSDSWLTSDPLVPFCPV